MILGLRYCFCITRTILGLVIIKVHDLVLLAADDLCTALVALIVECIDLRLRYISSKLVGHVRHILVVSIESAVLFLLGRLSHYSHVIHHWLFL